MDINAASRAVSTHVEEGRSVSGRDDLSASERIFVDVFTTNGGKALDAALAAGYAQASAHVSASKLLCRPRVAARIKAQCETFAHALLPAAIRALADICGDEARLPKDRIKAANSLIELAGMTAPHGGVNVNVAVQVNGQQAQQLIASVWDARAARLSDIPPAMPDTLDEDLETIEALAIAPPTATPGGVGFQGPAAPVVPLPVPSSEQPQFPDVSPDDAVTSFRSAFDEGDDDETD